MRGKVTCPLCGETFPSIHGKFHAQEHGYNSMAEIHIVVEAKRLDKRVRSRKMAKMLKGRTKPPAIKKGDRK